MKKPLPFTRSLAEFSRNRSQKDVTVTSADQIVTAAAAAVAGGVAGNATVPVNLNQSPTHQAKGKSKGKYRSNYILITGESSADKFLSGICSVRVAGC